MRDLLGVWIANGTDVLFRVAELETLGFNNTLNSFETEKLSQAKLVLYIAPHKLWEGRVTFSKTCWSS